jgi:hypothetical protein
VASPFVQDGARLGSKNRSSLWELKADGFEPICATPIELNVDAGTWRRGGGELVLGHLAVMHGLRRGDLVSAGMFRSQQRRAHAWAPSGDSGTRQRELVPAGWF